MRSLFSLIIRDTTPTFPLKLSFPRAREIMISMLPGTGMLASEGRQERFDISSPNRMERARKEKKKKPSQIAQRSNGSADLM